VQQFAESNSIAAGAHSSAPDEKSKREMMTDPINELTFAGWLAEFTAIRAKEKEDSSHEVLIASGAIEERQVDAEGHVRRCDLRFNSLSGRKLASGELKRPEVPEGRDPRNELLRSDARRKAIARGLPYYFTCNMAAVVLYAVADGPHVEDTEVGEFILAPIARSGDAAAYRSEIQRGWCDFVDALEAKLAAIGRTRPTVTTADVIAIRDAIFAVANEVLPRVVRRVRANPLMAEELRQESARSFNFPVALEEKYPAKFREELLQLLRFGIFVVTQKLILYRVLEDAGPRRAERYELDQLEVPRASTDPQAIRTLLDQAFSQARRRSRDYETAFLPQPFVDLVFSDLEVPQEWADCQVGEVWFRLLCTVKNVSWLSINQNIVGLLYEVIVEERFRHQLGQFYTPEDVVDLLTVFAMRDPGELILDPASGGGSFLRSAYRRKRALGETHISSLANIWGCEVTAFAAELSTVTLATSDTQEPAAYPRVILSDFFDLHPNSETELEIPGEQGRLRIPVQFDAVIGNPPYISYRRITNQSKILNAIATASPSISVPKFSGKSDAYVWFIVHGTQFLKPGGRLSFVVSSAILFSDYGIPLIRFIGHHYRIRCVVDSMVERWFPEADTNTVLLMLERETSEEQRANNNIRFIRLRRPLAQLIPDPSSPERRGCTEELIQLLLAMNPTEDDPRMQVNLVRQGLEGGLQIDFADSDQRAFEEDEDES
jgi:hypothetical protein